MGPLGLLTSALSWQEKMAQPIEGGRKDLALYHQFTQDRLDGKVGRQRIICNPIALCSFPPEMWWNHVSTCAITYRSALGKSKQYITVQDTDQGWDCKKSSSASGLQILQ